MGDRDIEQAVLAAVESTGVKFEVMPCDPSLADTAAFCAHYGVAPDESANTILVAGRSDPPVFAACVVLATTRLDVNGIVRRRLGVRKASFASPDDTVRLTGMTVGGVTPFGLPPDLPLWVDRRVMARASVVVGGGSRSMKLRIPPRALEALANVELVDDLAKAPDAQTPDAQTPEAKTPHPQTPEAPFGAPTGDQR